MKNVKKKKTNIDGYTAAVTVLSLRPLQNRQKIDIHYIRIICDFFSYSKNKTGYVEEVNS